jgi:CHASE2 domain-containing sensor protein
MAANTLAFRRPVLSAASWKAFLKLLWHDKISLGVILVTVTLLHAAGLFERFELPVMDLWQRLMPSKPAQHVRVITIDDELFNSRFEGKLPLAAEPLGALLDRVAAADPLVIAVDINTSSPAFAPLADQSRWPLIVWARSGKLEGENIAPTAILGGHSPVKPWSAGIALGHGDSDAVIRRVRRAFDTKFGPRASFHWAVVSAACEAGLVAPACHNKTTVMPNPSPSDPFVTVYRRRLQLRPLPAQMLESGAAPTDGPAIAALKDRVVLVGGTFGTGDRHRTPLGEMSGVEIWAHTIEAELEGLGIEHVSKFWLVTADASVALLIMWLRFFLAGRLAFVIYIMIVPVAMMLASFVAFRATALWLGFVPIVAAILIHQLFFDFTESVHTVEHAPAAPAEPSAPAAPAEPRDVS